MINPNTATININSPITVRQLGLRALRESLGAVGMVRFMQQFEEGCGDYTREKYLNEDISMEEIKERLKSYI